MQAEEKFQWRFVRQESERNQIAVTGQIVSDSERLSVSLHRLYCKQLSQELSQRSRNYTSFTTCLWQGDSHVSWSE